MLHNRGRRAKGVGCEGEIINSLQTRKCADSVSSSSKVLTVQEYWPDITGWGRGM